MEPELLAELVLKMVAVLVVMVQVVHHERLEFLFTSLFNFMSFLLNNVTIKIQSFTANKAFILEDGTQ